MLFNEVACYQKYVIFDVKIIGGLASDFQVILTIFSLIFLGINYNNNRAGNKVDQKTSEAH